MARPKIPRKSTTVDMTAMCDVAFLLLSFFILTAKPKPSEAVPINTPNSVSSKVAPETNLILISLNKDGHVYLSTGDSKQDRDTKEDILNSVNGAKNLGLTPADISALKAAPFIGVSLAQLSQQARMAPDQMNSQSLPGIPASDTTNNQMIDWMKAVKDVYSGRSQPNILLKGDNVAKYPEFKNILIAFKRNDFLKFQMVTNPEGIPQGTDLYKQNMNTPKKAG